MDRQLECLASEGLAQGCAYPHPDVLEGWDLRDRFSDAPYSLALARGTAQLEPVFFAPTVLSRYEQDPRYLFEFDDYSGTISIADGWCDEDADGVLLRDQVFMQTFGLGWTPTGKPCIAVFASYLMPLTSEHQRYWQTFEIDQRGAKIDPDYWRNSIAGEFTPHGSLIQALLSELDVINEMATAMGRHPLFRNAHKGNRPVEFTPFLVPTLHGFQSFALALDKVLSDNINRKFFRGEVPHEEEYEKDGKRYTRAIGTIRQLEMWLRSGSRAALDDPVPVIVKGFKLARKARQKPAHRIEPNQYSEQFVGDYRRLLDVSYRGLRTLRLTFANDTACQDVSIPEWLYEGRIRDYLVCPYESEIQEP
tara:strand:+ start:2267 stop:3358 length:1092 start_codon:yes stop_codon:yes gene_type:complete